MCVHARTHAADAHLVAVDDARDEMVHVLVVKIVGKQHRDLPSTGEQKEEDDSWVWNGLHNHRLLR